MKVWIMTLATRHGSEIHYATYVSNKHPLTVLVGQQTARPRHELWIVWAGQVDEDELDAVGLSAALYALNENGGEVRVPHE